MRRHLTQDELIDYQFELADKAQRAEAAEHLAECRQCRDQLEALKRRFAALDLLSGEIKAPTDLISRTVSQAAKSKPRRHIPFLPAWGGAVAAVLVMGAMLMVSNIKPGTPRVHSPKGSGGDQAQIEKPFPTKRPDDISHRLLPGGGHHPTDPTAPTHLASIDDTPPFAPASAIELVTLPRRDNVRITIYNSADLTLVREQRKLTLKRGWNWLQFMWANTLIDPTSMSLEPQEQREKIDVQQLVFPPRLRELGRWLIRSEISGQVPFELTYFTSGLSWRAFYMGTLSQDEKSMNLTSYVRVSNNSGEDYENAQTRLLVGEVHMLDKIADLARRKHAYNSPIVETDEVYREENRIKLEAAPVDHLRTEAWFNYADTDLALHRKEIVKEGLSEYFLYTIEGTETIPNQWGKRLQSFEANDIDIESLYKYDESRYGNQTIRFVKFANDEDHNLGETPIPDGQFRIYGYADAAGHLTYVGGTSVKYIPVDEEIELNLGAARLVKVEPKLMEFETENYTYDSNKDISGWDELRRWDIEATNTRELPVDLEITRDLNTTYWALQLDSPDVQYEKHDARNARFTLNLAPRSQKKIAYTVRTYHGRRQDAWKDNSQ